MCIRDREHAVSRARAEYQVSGDGAANRAEHIQRAHAAHIAGSGACGDIGGLHGARVFAGNLAECAVQVDQAGPADQALVGNATELFRKTPKYLDFFRRTRWEADVATLGFQPVSYTHLDVYKRQPW